MRLKDHMTVVLLSCTIIFLVGALITCLIFLNDKSSQISDAQRKLDDYSSQLKQNKEKIKNAEEELKNKQAEIDSAKAENEELKKQNTELTAKKSVASETSKTITVAASKKPAQNMPNHAQIERTNKLIISMSLPKVDIQPPKNGICYLTFDDGPSNTVTPRILDILAKYNIKATFFVTGTGNLSLLPRIAAEGHTIGLHTNTHNCYVKNDTNIYYSIENYLLDLKAVSDKVESIVGKKSSIIRFPGGSSNNVSKICPGIMTNLSKLLPDMGYSYFDWNVLSGDANANNVPAKRIINNVLSQASNKQSICVLMHDTDAKSTTADALEQIIIGLSGMGFHFESLTPETFGYHQTVAN